MHVAIETLVEKLPKAPELMRLPERTSNMAKSLTEDKSDMGFWS